MVANVLGLPQVFGTRELWPILVSVILVPAFFQLILMNFAVESPKHLFFSSDDSSEAEKGTYGFVIFSINGIRKFKGNILKQYFKTWC